jgi:hypothetical protein
VTVSRQVTLAVAVCRPAGGRLRLPSSAGLEVCGEDDNGLDLVQPSSGFTAGWTSGGRATNDRETVVEVLHLGQRTMVADQ